MINPTGIIFYTLRYVGNTNMLKECHVFHFDLCLVCAVLTNLRRQMLFLLVSFLSVVT